MNRNEAVQPSETYEIIVPIICIEEDCCSFKNIYAYDYNTIRDCNELATNMGRLRKNCCCFGPVYLYPTRWVTHAPSVGCLDTVARFD